jgi:hypothetical protein
MRECVPPDVHNAIYERAKGRCECEDPACSHSPGTCAGNLVNCGVSLPENTREQEMIAQGRYLCETCFQRTGSYVRQEAWRRPRSLGS